MISEKMNPSIESQRHRTLAMAGDGLIPHKKTFYLFCVIDRFVAEGPEGAREQADRVRRGT